MSERKIKVGIITFHNADNYGAVLQCYALQKFIQCIDERNEVFVVDYKNKYIEKTYKVFQMTSNFRFFVSQIVYLLQVIHKRQKFHKFRKKYFNISSPFFKNFDIIVYGSDQIWNPSLINQDLVFFGKDFFGKKIGYAVSDGGELVVDEKIRRMINDFSEISCRELSLKERLDATIPEKEKCTVCDPVFLLKKEKWLEIAKKPVEKNYILAYQISKNENFDREIEKIGATTGKEVIQIVYVKPIKKLICRNQKIKACLSPEEFIGYFAYADYIITTSFHGTAFSLIFNKPFNVLSFGKRSERIVDLLKILRLENHFVEKIDKIEGVEDYSDILKSYIAESKAFLIRNMKDL